MKSCASAWLYPQRPLTLMALGAVALASVQAAYADGEIVGAPIDLSAFVHEALLPGGTLFDNTQTVTGALTTPKQSAKNFHLGAKGENLSGRSKNIDGAFASALAESNGNGGVGVRPGSEEVRATPIRPRTGSLSPRPSGNRTSPTTALSRQRSLCTSTFRLWRSG